LSRLHTALAFLTLLAGCTPVLPPESVRPLPAPPWTDPADSVTLEADCSSGQPQACRTLAVRFFREDDEVSARRVLSAGCLGASGDACWRWGTAFLVSDRVHEDSRLARAMFEAGCEGGSMKSCRGLYRTLLEPAPLFPEKPLREIRLSSTR
jgi:hypothetical protein